MNNSIGRYLKVTSFGESHGPCVGAVIDGVPAGLNIDTDFIIRQLQRRRPGQSNVSTTRSEEDMPQILSGVFEGKSTGAPIAIIIPNKNQESKDYNHLKEVFRPSHADYTYHEKYGIRDHRGGGRSSARITSAWVAAGAIANLMLKAKCIEIFAFTYAIGTLSMKELPLQLSEAEIERNSVRCPDEDLAKQMEELIIATKEAGDSLGGIVQVVVKGMPVGLGDPVFAKIDAQLAHALMNINAVKGVEIGSGFKGSASLGSVENDSMSADANGLKFNTNHSGGIQGGISNGADLLAKVAFKPVASINKEQNTVDTSGKETQLKIEGRHDPCVVPRAIPIVEAMVAITLADALLAVRLSKW